jgi:hypothetical protein
METPCFSHAETGFTGHLYDTVSAAFSGEVFSGTGVVVDVTGAGTVPA